MAFTPDPVFRVETAVRYDLEKGEMVIETVNALNSDIREVIEVRKQLEDEVLLKALVYELTKRGYTVIPPEQH